MRGGAKGEARSGAGCAPSKSPQQWFFMLKFLRIFRRWPAAEDAVRGAGRRFRRVSSAG